MCSLYIFLISSEFNIHSCYGTFLQCWYICAERCADIRSHSDSLLINTLCWVAFITNITLPDLHICKNWENYGCVAKGGFNHFPYMELYPKQAIRTLSTYSAMSIYKNILSIICLALEFHNTLEPRYNFHHTSKHLSMNLLQKWKTVTFWFFRRFFFSPLIFCFRIGDYTLCPEWSHWTSFIV